MVYKKLEYDGLKMIITLSKYYIETKIGLTKLQKYRKKMKEFFEKRGSKTATPEQLTVICDEWYIESRNKWNGYTKFYIPELSATSDGIKGGDNYKLVCEPSTNTYKGRDDYAGNPLFIPTDCNWEMTDDGEPLITSIEGIDCLNTFTRNDPNKFVGVLQMTGYHWWNTPNKNDSKYLYEGYCSEKISNAEIISRIQDATLINIAPLPEAVINENADVSGRILLENSVANVRSWVCHSKYEPNLTSNNALTSYSGSPVISGSISLTSIHTYANNTSAAHGQSYTYSGHTMCDTSFLILMYRIKYASLASKDHLAGCGAYQYAYTAAVAESNTSRVILTAANAENIEIGSTVRIGSSATRNDAAAYSISGINGYVVTGKVPVGSNVAIVVDNGTRSFSTTTTTYLHTHTWRTGVTDNILGNDGSPTNPLSGKEPVKLQGIEYMNGVFVIAADIINNYTTTESTPYFVRRVSQQSESVTNNYISSNTPYKLGGGYITYMYFNGGNSGLYFPYRPNSSSSISIDIPAGSSSIYTKNNYATSSDTSGAHELELYLGGIFTTSLDQAGLCYESSYDGVTTAAYHLGTRLSCNGNRGVYNINQ